MIWSLVRPLLHIKKKFKKFRFESILSEKALKMLSNGIKIMSVALTEPEI